jgi:AcrR family transcriptional regulator
MSTDVKRTYSSALRAEQARTTRRAIVAAARELFERDGYGATTIDAIAAAAGVSRKTIFTSVGGKLEALKLARDWAIVGDDEPVSLMERPTVQRGLREPDARVIVRDLVVLYCEVMARVVTINHVIDSAAGLDEGVRALADEGRRQRRFGMGKLAERLAELDALRDDLTPDEAADLLTVYNEPALYRWLVRECGWAIDRFQAWLTDAIETAVLRPA